MLIRWRTVRSLTRSQTPQPHASPRAVRLHPCGGGRSETRYIWWVIFWQRVSPLSMSSGPQPASANSFQSITTTSRSSRPDDFPCPNRLH